MKTKILSVFLIIFLSSCMFFIDDYSEVLEAQETAVHSVLEISESGEVIAEGKVSSVSGLGSDCSVRQGQCYFSMKVEGVIVDIHYLSDYDPDRTECLNTAASEQAIKVRGGDHVKLFGKYLSAGSISTCGDLDYYIEIIPSQEQTHTITPVPTTINPAATTQAISPSETSRPDQAMLRSTPMGDGVLTDQIGFHMAELMHSFSGNLFTWLMYDNEGRAVIVYAGVNTIDQQQGKMIVVREGTIWGPYGDHIEIPTRSGRPVIIDAVGKRLIIETEMGDIFYFDVPSGKFANSLTETLATMTPGPTLTPRVAPTPDNCNPTQWQENEIYLLSTKLFGAMGPGGPSTYIRILIDKNPAWADFQQEDHGEMRAAGYIFYESSFGPELGMGANPAVVLVVYGVKNDWALPVNGDLVSAVYQIRDSLYHDESEWNFGDIDQSQYPTITNGATYALYRYFDGNMNLLESWCRTYVEVYGESSLDEDGH